MTRCFLAPWARWWGNRFSRLLAPRPLGRICHTILHAWVSTMIVNASNINVHQRLRDYRKANVDKLRQRVRLTQASGPATVIIRKEELGARALFKQDSDVLNFFPSTC